jgi:hypothetical protein
MSLAEMNSYLLRLYTDDCFRLLATLRPEATLRAYALSADEIAALGDLDPEVVAEFADSIKAKRLGRLEDNYPLLFDHLEGAAMARYADRFYQIHRVSPSESSGEYHQAFGDFIEATLAMDEVMPRWAADLARYARLDCVARFAQPPAPRGDEGSTRPSPRARAHLLEGVYRGEFEHEITAVVCALRGGGSGDPAPIGPQHLVWQRVDGESSPRVFAVSPAFARLLALSDEGGTVQEIAGKLARELGVEVGMDTVVAALVDLKARGLVALVEPGRVGAEGGIAA